MGEGERLPNQKKFLIANITDTLEVWKMLILNKIAMCDARETLTASLCHCKCLFCVPK